MNVKRLALVAYRYRLAGGFIIGAVVVLMAIAFLASWTATARVIAKPRETISLPGIAKSIVISPDAKEAAATFVEHRGGGEFVRRWSFPNGAGSKVCDGHCFVSFLPEGNRIAIGTADGVQILDRQSNAELRRLSGRLIPGGGSAFAVVSHDGKWLAATDDIGSMISIWNIANGTGPQFIIVPNRSRGIFFSKNNDELVVVRESTEFEVWNLASVRQTLITNPLAPNDMCYCSASTANGELVAVASFDAKIRVWSSVEKKIVADFDSLLSSNARPPLSICFSADDRILFLSANICRKRLDWSPEEFPYFYLGDFCDESEFKAFDTTDWTCKRTWYASYCYDKLVPIPRSRDLLSFNSVAADIWRWDDLGK